MMRRNRFEDLECWQEASSLSEEIYKITTNGALGRDNTLRPQMRSAAISVAANIAEGKERETKNEFVRFLYIAKGSAGEMKSHLNIAFRIGYLKEDLHQELYQKYDRLSGMIGGLIKHLKSKK